MKRNEVVIRLGTKRDSPDYAGLLAKHDIVYQSPAYHGFEGFPIGNGDVASMVWQQPYETVFTINKSDAWDRRDSDEGIVALRSCGRLRIEESVPAFAWEHLVGYESRLDMYRAEIRTASTTRFSDVRARAFVTAENNTLVVRYQSNHQAPSRLRVILESWSSRVASGWYSRLQPPSGAIYDETSSGADEAGVWVKVPLGDQAAASYCTAHGRGDVRIAVDNDHRAVIEIAPSASHDWVFVVGVVTGEDDERKSLVAEARRTAEETLSRLSAHEELHRAFWQRFWSKGFVNIPDDYLENLYYFNLYQMASAARKVFPNLFCGGPWIWNYDIRNWANPHHWNQQMMTWPLFAANRTELALPYIRTYARMMDKARAYAAELGCPDGIQITDMHTFFGDMLGRNIKAFNKNYSPAAQIGLIMWWYFQYTWDVDFLREVAYPWLRACMAFYLHVLEWDETEGRYTWRATPYELGAGVIHRDTITDNAMIHRLCKIVPAAAEILGLDDDMVERCRDVRSKLPDYHRVATDSGEVFVFGLDEDSRPLLGDTDAMGRRYAPVYPAGEIGLSDIGTPNFETAVNSVRFHGLEGPCIAPKIAAFARLGLGEEAWHNLKMSARRMQHFPQGFFYNIDHWPAHSPRFEGTLPEYIAELNRIGDRWVDLQRDYIHDARAHYVVNRRTDPINIPAYPFVQAGLESMGLFCVGIQEMLLQSYDGRIRVFPAVPSEWVGSFRLRAAGGFMVAAETKGQGRAERVVIESEAGRPCVLEAAWSIGQEGVRVFDATAGRYVECSADGGLIHFPTDTGHEYYVGVPPLEQTPPISPVAGPRNPSCKSFYEAQLGKPRDFPALDAAGPGTEGSAI